MKEVKKERRAFLKLLGLSSGIAIATPTKIIASISEETERLDALLGHKTNAAPKKIITSLRDLNEFKISKSSSSERLYAKKLSFKSNFQILKRVSYKTDKKIFMFNDHTGETINLVYWSQGQYIKENLNKINYFMRDFREDKVKRMSLVTLNAVNDISHHTKRGVPLKLNSGFRTKRSNRKVGGAKKSKHLLYPYKWYC